MAVAANKCNVFMRPATRYGKVYASDSVGHLPERPEGLVNTRMPATAGRLMQFLQTVNWMPTSSPGLAEVVEAVHELLEALLAGTSRMKRVAKNKTIQESDGTTERRAAWDGARDGSRMRVSQV